MKFRSDFVTNSSSSSFVVELDVNIGKDKSVHFERSQQYGDYDGTDIFARINDGKDEFKKGVDIQTLMDEVDMGVEDDDIGEMIECFPSILFEGAGVGLEDWNLNLNNFVKENSMSRFKKALASNFYGIKDENADDEEDEWDEDEDYGWFDSDKAKEIADAIRKSVAAIDKRCSAVFEAVTERKQISSMKIRTTFDGWGECTPYRDDILERIYGTQEAQEILEICACEDKEEAIEELKALSCLDHVANDSLGSLFDFVQNFEYEATCDFVQRYEAGKEIEYSIDY